VPNANAQAEIAFAELEVPSIAGPAGTWRDEYLPVILSHS